LAKSRIAVLFTTWLQQFATSCLGWGFNPQIYPFSILYLTQYVLDYTSNCRMASESPEQFNQGPQRRQTTQWRSIQQQA